MEHFSSGLLLSVVGLLTTFGALGLLYITIIVLRRLFSPPLDPDAQERALVATSPPLQPGADADAEKEAVAAAVGVRALLAEMQSAPRPQLGARLQQPPGRWWSQPRNAGPKHHSRRYHYD